MALTTLETQRQRGDLIEVFKIFMDLEDVSYNTYFTVSQLGLHGHLYKLYKPYAMVDIRNFFPIRVIDIWNSLPCSVLQCRTVDTFKRHLFDFEVGGQFCGPLNKADRAMVAVLASVV